MKLYQVKDRKIYSSLKIISFSFEYHRRWRFDWGWWYWVLQDCCSSVDQSLHDRVHPQPDDPHQYPGLQAPDQDQGDRQVPAPHHLPPLIRCSQLSVVSISTVLWKLSSCCAGGKISSEWIQDRSLFLRSKWDI